MKSKKKFNTTLREEREKLFISQFTLALEFSVSAETIRKIERCESVPNVFLAMDIAKFFGKTVEDMFWIEY